MSKRLNKRQQRELEELEMLKAQEKAVAAEKAEDEEQAEEEAVEDKAEQSAPFNAFAALEGDGTTQDQEEEEEEEEETVAAAPKKVAPSSPGLGSATHDQTKKKKPKKKKQSGISTPGLDDAEASTPGSGKGGKKKKQGDKADPFAGMDEVDRALAELNMKDGGSADAGPSRATAAASETRQFMAWRNLLSVDPKNLDADAELRRFFGSKVIASSAQSGGNRHRPGPSAKLRYTISKPKPTYPPATSLSGLGMREMSEEEVEEVLLRRSVEGVSTDKGEKWFTFEHSPQWREVERQFMGAVRSHDPNELMALLQVYPWHVDTLLQMSEVYRLQSDIGAASEYAERALYAFDRCLVPSFNVSSGTCRLDFDRVENRPMFTALHRIISYLGRRGCWVTAFNFAKLLYSLDPFGDPHGAAFWLDFLAVKSNNGEWLISMLEQASSSTAAMVWHGYPGMAYAQALALRADEDAKKHGDHSESDAALQEAIRKFPQVVVPLADKISANIPNAARGKKETQIEAGYTDSPTNVIHLLSHIYVARSEALWKEPSLIAWFEAQVAATLGDIDSPTAVELRSDALDMMQVTRDPIDETLNVPLFICRHVVCSESTSWLGFLPPAIRNRPVHAFDPLPPSTAVSAYNDAYFAGVRPGRGGQRGGLGPGGGGGVLEGFMDRLMGAMQGEGWQERVEGVWRDMTGRREFANVPEEERNNLLQQLLEMGQAIGGVQVQAGEDGDGRMPGGFPGAEEE